MSVPNRPSIGGLNGKINQGIDSLQQKLGWQPDYEKDPITEVELLKRQIRELFRNDEEMQIQIRQAKLEAREAKTDAIQAKVSAEIAKEAAYFAKTKATWLEIQINSLWAAFRAFTASVPLLVSTITKRILASVLLSAVAQIVGKILAGGSNDLSLIKQLAQGAKIDARAAATIAVKAEGKADKALTVTEKLKQELDLVVKDALRAMQRLEAFIKSEIATLTKQTLDALLRLQNRIGSIEGIVKEINNVVKGIIGQIQTLANQVIQLQQFVNSQIANLTTQLQQLFSTVTNLQGLFSALQAQFTNLQNLVVTQVNNLQIQLTKLQTFVNTQIQTLTTTINSIKISLENQLKNLKLDIGTIFGQLATLAGQIVGISLALSAINALIKAFKPGGVVNNYFITNNNNNVTNVTNPVDNSLLRRIDATTTANLATSQSNNGILNAVNAVTSATLGIVGSIVSVVGIINNKMGGLIQNGGLSGWMLRFTSHQIFDRVINFMTLAATIHNATQLSSSIGTTLIQAMQNVIDLFGLKDSENQQYNLSELIGRSLNSLASAIVGEENMNGIKEQWAKYNRIYQAAGNLFSSLLSMGDTMINAVNTISGQNAKIANALRIWGVVGEKAYGWMNITPNFNNPLLTKLQSLDDTANVVSQVSQEPLNVKAAKEELENTSKEAFDALAQEPGKPQGKEVPEAKTVKEQETQKETESATPDIDLTDLFEDDD